MIKITKELLSRWFDKVNNEFFSNELRKPDFVITHNRGYFGQFRPSTWTIDISIYWIRSERDYMNTLIHECCHCYVRQKYGSHVQSHGGMSGKRSLTALIGKCVANMALSKDVVVVRIMMLSVM